MDLFLFLIIIGLIVLYFNKDNELKKTVNENSKLRNEINNLKAVLSKPLEIVSKTNSDNYKLSDKSDYFQNIKKTSSKYPSITQEDIAYFADKKIDKKFLYPIKELDDQTNFFFGKKCVITGDFTSFTNRNEMAKLLWEVGADVDLNIGKNTKIVIIGDNPGPSKLIQAEDLGVEFVTENEFKNHFNIN